jgi:hypothetical protein
VECIHSYSFLAPYLIYPFPPFASRALCLGELRSGMHPLLLIPCPLAYSPLFCTSWHSPSASRALQYEDLRSGMHSLALIPCPYLISHFSILGGMLHSPPELLLKGPNLQGTLKYASTYTYVYTYMVHWDMQHNSMHSMLPTCRCIICVLFVYYYLY